MAKRLIAVALVFSFLSLIGTPVFAETQADRDASQSRAVVGMIGLVALVGVFFMLNKMGDSASNINEENLKTKTFAQKQNTGDQRLSAGLDFTNSGYYPNNHDNGFVEAKNEVRSPELKVTYAW